MVEVGGTIVTRCHGPESGDILSRHRRHTHRSPAMSMRRLSFALPLAVLSLQAATGLVVRAGQTAPPPAAASAARPADHVIVISIDGFCPAMYLDSDREGVTLPHLQAVRAEGSAAEGMVAGHL